MFAKNKLFYYYLNTFSLYILFIQNCFSDSVKNNLWDIVTNPAV